MDSSDLSSAFEVPYTGSRLLSESPLNSRSQTSTSVDDLSLADLSLTDKPRPRAPARPKFSLLAQPRYQDASHDESAIAEEDEGDEADSLDHTMTPEEAEKARNLAAKTREEQLEHDLFVLRKLNSVFEVYKDALRETESSTERIAEKLAHTNALLDKYVTILAKSDRVRDLILDERWEGADADEEQIERELREEIERRRREEEEREEAARREQKRREHEEQQRQEREERERLERERAGSRTSTRGGVRGVRGTRASVRGLRGSASARSATASTSRGSTPPVSASASSATSGIRRTGSSTSTRGSTTTRASGIARRR